MKKFTPDPLVRTLREIESEALMRERLCHTLSARLAQFAPAVRHVYVVGNEAQRLRIEYDESSLQLLDDDYAKLDVVAPDRATLLASATVLQYVLSVDAKQSLIAHSRLYGAYDTHPLIMRHIRRTLWESQKGDKLGSQICVFYRSAVLSKQIPLKPVVLFRVESHSHRQYLDIIPQHTIGGTFEQRIIELSSLFRSSYER
jgi:hypothetical protein